MTLAFSTSSPWASAALFDEMGALVWADRELAPQNASSACLRLLERFGLRVGDVKLFASDLGPGSFTGVRVGVMLAKTLAWTVGGRCTGSDAFDLISPGQTVALPSKKGEWFVRRPGEEPVRGSSVPSEALGYGFEGGEMPPDASRFGPLLGSLEVVSPELLVPNYLIEASISQPKKPLARI